MMYRAHTALFLVLAVIAFPGHAAPNNTDGTFGIQGQVRFGAGPSNDSANDMAVLGDGRIVVVGTSYNGSTYDMAVMRLNADGSRDATFGVNGQAIVRPPGSVGAYAGKVTIDASGRYLVGGSKQITQSYEIMVVVRLLANGTVDTGFGTNGHAVVDWGLGSSYVGGIVVQPDNKIVIGGSVLNGQYEYTAARLNDDGTPDPAFGTAGRVRYAAATSGKSAFTGCATRQTDGKIVFGGYENGAGAFTDEVTALRLNADGTLDITYGTGGISRTTAGGSIFDCTLQPDDKLALAGYRMISGFPNVRFAMKIARLTTTGALDSAFAGGAGNIELTGIASGSTSDVGQSIAIQGDGKIVVAGYTGSDNANGIESFAIVRYNADGTLDNTFGNGNGTRFFPFQQAVDSLGTSVAIAPGGALLMAGNADAEFAIARFTAAGNVDTTFGTAGAREHDLGNGSDGGFTDVKRANDGRLYLALQQNMGVARLNADGSRDGSFGLNGVTFVAGASPASTRIAVAGDGSSVVVGSMRPGNVKNAAIARFLADGTLDPVFGLRLLLPAGALDGDFQDVLIQPDGKVVAAGWSITAAGDRGLIARFNADGTPDAGFGSGGNTLFDIAGLNVLGRSVILQPDGRLVVGADVGPGNVGLARFSAAGVKEPGFGTSIDSGGDDSMASLLLLADGNILVAGTTSEARGNLGPVIIRASGTTGALDPTFGVGGRSVPYFCGLDSSRVSSALLQPDGRIVLGGALQFFQPPSEAAPKRGPNDPGSIIARWNADGTLDASFGGRIIDGGPSGSAISGMALLPDQRIVTAGSVFGAREGQGIISRYAGGTSLAGPARRDSNCDTYADISWRDPTDQMAVWAMSGATPVASALLLGPGTGWQATHNGLDLNADGMSDFVWRNTDGSTAIWLTSDLGVLDSAVLLGRDSPWTMVATGDLNGDGRSDLLFANVDGTIAAWLMNGLQVLDSATILGPGTGYSVANLGDFNGDGKSDIVFRNTDGSISLWLMNGLAVQSSTLLLGSGTDWRPGHIGDLDGDGKSDIVWTNNTSGDTAVWLMDGIAIGPTAVIFGGGGGWSITHVADFDDDGRADLLWRHTSGMVAMWTMNGLAAQTTALILGPGTPWVVEHTRDFNGDNMADLLWRNTADASVALWQMKGISVIDSDLLFGGFGGWVPSP